MSDKPGRLRTWILDQLAETEMTQADLARAIGVANSRISAWVNEKDVPSPHYVQRLAEAFRADPDYVLALAGHRRDSERDLLSEIPIEVRWYFMNYKRLPLDRQKILLAQLRAYYADLGLPDPTTGLLED